MEADRARNSKLVGVYRLPSPIVFHGSCAGLSVCTRVGADEARVTLPEIAQADRFPSVQPPSIGGVPAALMVQMRDAQPERPFYARRWGDTLAFDADGQSVHRLLVSDIVLEYLAFPVATLRLVPSATGRKLDETDALDQLFAQVDLWFERVAAWVAILGEQPMDLAGRIRSSFAEGEGLVLAALDDVGHTDPVTVGWAMYQHHKFQPLNKETWLRAVELGAAYVRPPPAYTLIAEASTALALEDYRLAVIQAATAVEVVASERLEADLTALASPLTSALLTERRTLGRLVGLLRDVYDLPAGIAQFVEVRNRAIHKNYVPDRPEAEEGLRIAREVLRLFLPLDDYLHPVVLEG